MIIQTEKFINWLNELKKHTFFEILNLVGRVYIVVDFDQSVVIGRRGFLPEEKERGLVLVFNNKMNFVWNEHEITATLVFGNVPEKCHIPLNAITGIFSPELRIQLTMPFIKIIKEKEERDDQNFNKIQQNKKNKKRDKIVDITKLRKDK
ncbi:MAG: ClpXP protease specificity-enhancing factor SspB [Thermodesulfovibrio sp.]|nr:ClpXP protease specificity-enhancing factor SspB [Thermodesulfovibrio sp.]